MSAVRVEKVVSALPAVLEANTAYFLRVRTGFDIHVTDSDGNTPFRLNSPFLPIPDFSESDATYFYDGWINVDGLGLIQRQDKLTSITMSNRPTLADFDTAWLSREALEYA